MSLTSGNKLEFNVTPELLEKFEEKFVKTDFCWVWRGTTTTKGYGQFYCKEVGDVLAHRASYVIYKDKIPDGLNALHKCDNPLCVNPDHLFLGTQKDNIVDMIQKGRKVISHIFGHKNPKSIFSESQVDEMRLLYSQGNRISEIHKIFGGSYQSVWSIIKGKTWMFGQERTCGGAEPQISNSRKYPKEHHFLISPTGKEFFVGNVSKFCRENNLSRDGIKSIIYGKSLNYKGWTRAKI